MIWVSGKKGDKLHANLHYRLLGFVMDVGTPKDSPGFRVQYALFYHVFFLVVGCFVELLIESPFGSGSAKYDFRSNPLIQIKPNDFSPSHCYSVGWIRAQFRMRNQFRSVQVAGTECWAASKGHVIMLTWRQISGELEVFQSAWWSTLTGRSVHYREDVSSWRQPRSRALIQGLPSHQPSAIIQSFRMSRIERVSNSSNIFRPALF